MARGRTIKGLEEAVREAVESRNGITSPEIRQWCDDRFNEYISQNTINSIISRLVKAGIFMQDRNKFPFQYHKKTS